MFELIMVKVFCVKCHHSDVTFYREQRADGGYHVRCTCLNCGANATGNPFVNAKEYGIEDVNTLAVMELPANQLISCEVIGCTNRGAQLHHLAPRNKFNGESDLWPTMFLCHYHHVEWHWRVEGLNLDNEIVTRIRGQS